MDEVKKKMSHASVIARNPAFVEELESDEDGVDPVDPAPSISGNDPIITVPASDDEEEKVKDILRELERSNAETENILKEMREIMSFLPEGTSSGQHPVTPNVDVWDTGKVIEQEYRLYPDPTMKEVRYRLSNQVWDLLQILHGRVHHQTYNSKDIELISGLKLILVLNSRLSVITETVIKHRAKRP